MPDTKAAKPSAAYLIKLAFICLASVALLGYCFANKAELHNDEYTAYIIANNSGEGGMLFSPEEGRVYTDPAQPYLDAMTVAPGQGFHYQTTVKNDTQDTLPPLYYLLLHTVCSFFPGQFSVWYGGVINMVLLVLSILLLSKLTRLLGMEAKQRLLTCLCFALLPGVIEIAQFIRMYTLSMLMTLWLTYAEIKWLKSGQFGLKQAVSIAIPTIAGVLSHYYFVLFAALQCLTIGVYLLAAKRFKTFGFYVLTFAAAAVVTIAVYPFILQQVFGGWLTPSAIGNLTTGSDMLERVKGYFFIINTRLFGGYLPEFALALLIGAVLFWQPRPSQTALPKRLEGQLPWLCILVPSALYALLMTKIAFFINTRYMSFIYPFIVIIGVQALIWLVSLAAGTGERKPFYSLAAVLCAVTLIAANQAYPMAEREYSGYEGGKLLQRVEQHADLRAVCVYDTLWKVQNTYHVNRLSSDVVFIKQNELSQLPGLLSPGSGGLLVEIEDVLDHEAVLNQLMTLYPDLAAANGLGDCSFFGVYVLE